MKKLIFAVALFSTVSATGYASEATLVAAGASAKEPSSTSPNEILIDSSCRYSIEHISDADGHIHKRKRIHPSWETGIKIASNNLYLSTSVACPVVT